MQRFPDVEFYDFERAWDVWVSAQNAKAMFGWAPLPYSGALLDQPEALMLDLVRINNAAATMRKEVEG